MTFSPGSLRATLEAHLPPAAAGLLVAVSGGADSSCLLSALVQSGLPAPAGLPLRAVHVDHGLQPAAADFRRACGALCVKLGVPLTIVEIRIEVAGGRSLEEAAREARYAALGRELGAGECLLTAHHADDQAESLLLQLLRGAGLAGLSAMPPCRPWRDGWHLRPLLDVTRRDLRAYGVAEGLAEVMDPMNEDLRFDRSYLRQRVWPLLTSRWPGAAATLSRAARHVAEAQELLHHSALDALRGLRDGDALSVTGLRRLTTAAQRNAVRAWIASAGVKPPSDARLTEALRQVLDARTDHQPRIAWGGHALRRYRDRMFITASRPPRLTEVREWPVAEGAHCELEPGLGSLGWVRRPGGFDVQRLPATLIVRPRRGGESLKPGPQAPTQTVQHLYQHAGVLPWMRDALPMVFAGDRLIAVADSWQDARWCVPGGQPGLAIEWRGAPDFV